VEHILAKHNAEDELADLPEKLREMLYHCDWTSNVRELTNTIQRYLATDSVAVPGRPLQASDQNMPAAAGLFDAMESLERKMIAAALQQVRWHRGTAARLLKIPPPHPAAQITEIRFGAIRLTTGFAGDVGISIF
jgi:DNA-binding NtrC family response regulator